MLVTADVAFVFDDFVVHTREDGRPIVVIVLGPAFVGVVVAFGALKAGAKKDLGGGFGARRGIAVRPIVICGWVPISAAARGQDLAGELIKGPIGGDALAYPMMEGLEAFL